MVNALYYLETAYYLEGPVTTPTSLLKNLGLGHVHLIQNNLLNEEIIPLPAVDLFDSLNKINWPTTGRYCQFMIFYSSSIFTILNSLLHYFCVRWKEWSANRFTEYWGAFLKREDATLDPQYPTIKHLYETVASAAAQTPQPAQMMSNPSSDKKGTNSKKKMKSKTLLKKGVENEF